jgi:hypothetical protein
MKLRLTHKPKQLSLTSALWAIRLICAAFALYSATPSSQRPWLLVT